MADNDEEVRKDVTVEPPQIEVGHDAVESTPPDVMGLAEDTFHKLSQYLHGELTSTCEDYALLEKMNRVTLHKYAEMKQIAVNVSTTMHDLNEKYKNLQPYLDQIDQIEQNVANLEQAAYKLDAYSKRLEVKFKTVEKR